LTQAYKVCYTRQRPIAQKTSGLGVWEDVLQVIGKGSALHNFSLRLSTSPLYPTLLLPHSAPPVIPFVSLLPHKKVMSVVGVLTNCE